MKRALSDIIVVMSAHCTLEKIDLTSHIRNLNKYVCVFGNQIPIWHGKRITKRYIWSHFTNKKVQNMFSKLEDRYFFHNAFSVFNTDYLRENLFDERLSGKEDRYWANEQIEKGQSILYDSTISVHHHYTDNGATWKGVG